MCGIKCYSQIGFKFYNALMLLVFRCLIAILLGCPIAANSAVFTYVENDKAALPEFETSIYMTGPIVEGDAATLETLIGQMRDAGLPFYRKAVLLLDSPGGALDPALKIAKTVYDQGLSTYIADGRQCLSGCAIVFMSGSMQDGDDTTEVSRSMHKRASLGFHAPFAFGNAEDIPPEVAQLLLKDAERGGSIAASKLVNLSLTGTMPASLIEELLQFDAGSFLFIDTVDRAARWSIRLQGAGPYRISPGVMQHQDRVHLTAHCESWLNWIETKSAANQVRGTWVLDEKLWMDGMATSCKYEPYNDRFSAQINGRRVDVLQWHTLPPETKLAAIPDEVLFGVPQTTDPFATPPPQQVIGQCHSGFQWLGGWSGDDYREAIAYALLRSCTASDVVPITLTCRHGSGLVETRFSLSAFGLGANDPGPVSLSVDGGREAKYHGALLVDRGFHEYGFSLARDYFTFKEMRTSTHLFITLGQQRFSVPLHGADIAIAAMQSACI